MVIYIYLSRFDPYFIRTFASLSTGSSDIFVPSLYSSLRHFDCRYSIPYRGVRPSTLPKKRMFRVWYWTERDCIDIEAVFT